MGYPQPNSGVRSIDASQGPTRRQIDAILRLQAAGRDDKARVGHIRAIRLYFALGIRAIFSDRGLDNFLPERSEQKRENQRGPDGVDGRQLTALRRVQNRASRQGGAPTRSPVAGVALALEDQRFARVAARTTGRHAGRRPELALRGGDRDWLATAAAERAGLRGRMR